MTYLLDANVLIALTIEEHDHHERATSWMVSVDRFAVCPIVEGALVRFLLRLGESGATAADLLRRVNQLPGCDFWGDAISYADIELHRIVGHRQVTDAYLVGLAHSHGAQLATLDRALSQQHREHTLLVPLAG